MYNSNADAWLQLSKSTRDLCKLVDESLRPIRPRDIIKKILNAFLFKADSVAAAIALLYENNLEEEAQALVRTMFELQLDFEYFVTMLPADPKAAAKRVVDAIIIQKAKQVRASGWAGIPEEVKHDIETDEAKAVGGYSSEALGCIRKYGFSGVSVEERARHTGHSEAYNILYRNFSRNVHNSDFMESFLKIGAYMAQDYDLLKETRDVAALKTTTKAMFTMLEVLNHFFKLKIDEKLKILLSRMNELRSPREPEA